VVICTLSLYGFFFILTHYNPISGGSILTTLLHSDKSAVKNLHISALVRNEAHAKRISELGVTPILFKNLDDVEVIRKAASESDGLYLCLQFYFSGYNKTNTSTDSLLSYSVVIHTASGFHQVSSEALVAGLGNRKAATGKDVYYIHVCRPFC
jgi:hypothetical protein